MNSSGVPSIHRRVLVWVMAALALGASLLVGSAWLTMTHELEEVFEDNLKQVALAVATHQSAYGITNQSAASTAAVRTPRIADPLPKIYEEYGDFDFVTAAWSLDGKLSHTSDSQVVLPFLSRSGSSRVTIGGQDWHLYTIVLDDGIVQAAQRHSARAVLARESSSQLVLPSLLMLAVLAVLLTLALTRGLRPLAQAADQVSARSAESLHPIPLQSQPAELHLLVQAINDLMQRLGNALGYQRVFLADAAHELRTPVTALKLQLQLLERAGTEDQHRETRRELRAGIDRAQHLIEQLLQLSRLAPDTPALQRDAVNLGALVRSTVASFSTRAEEQGIDLGAVVDAAPTISGDAQQLTILLNNLVDNALRHTPRGGKIDVGSASLDGRPSVTVADTGPGIPASERPMVFNRFYRGATSALTDEADQRVRGDAVAQGSGLGLAIVRAIADRHEADISLDQPGSHGLRVTVRFPQDRFLLKRH